MLLNVFISSSSHLKDERAVAAAAVQALGLRADIFEQWPALSESPEPASVAAVGEADIFLLLLGSRYGALASNGRSITHEEYLEAEKKSIPVLAFRIDETRPEAQQLEFIATVEKRQTIRSVQSLDDLRTQVPKAITQELAHQARTPAPQIAPPEVGLTSDRRSGITIDLQSEEIEHLRDALTKKAAEKLNDSRASFRAGRAEDAIKSLEQIIAEAEWKRVEASVRSRILTTLATFRIAIGVPAVEIEDTLRDAKNLDPNGDFSYLEGLLRYDRDGANKALDLLTVVKTTKTFNLKIALLLELGQLKLASELLAIPPESIEPDAETARLRAFVALAHRDSESAVQLIDAALKSEPQSESLRVADAIIKVASTIAADQRPDHVGPWLPPVDPAFVVTTPEMLARLESAEATLDEAIRSSQRSGGPFQQMQSWRLAAVALHPAKRERARAVASAMLEGDPADPAALFWSLAYDFEIDVERAVKALSGLQRPVTPERVIGTVASMAASGDIERAEGILEEHKQIFAEDEDLWRFWKVRLLTDSKRDEDAAALTTEISSSDLRESAELLIAETRARETNAWDEYLEVVDRIDPGYNALVARARLGRWNDVADEAVALVQTCPTAATIKLAAIALFRLRHNEQSLRLLNEYSSIWSLSSDVLDLQRLTIDNEIVLGYLHEALKGAQELFEATRSGRDLLLTVRTAIAAGRQKDARFWAARLLDLSLGEVGGGDLLQISRMVAIEDRELARRLWLRGEAAGFQDDLLTSAMSSAFALGLDAEGGKIFEVLQASPAGSNEFRPVSVQEFLASHQAAGKAFANAYRAYAAGDIPLAFLITNTRKSLCEIYEAQLTNATGSAVGSMAPLYLRHGGRMLNAQLTLNTVKTLTMDLSTILLADRLGVLEAIEKRFDTLRISPLACAALAEQQDRLQPAQPRVDAAHATLLRLFDEKRVAQSPVSTPSVLVAELVPRLGEEWATTMQAAVDHGGYFVDGLPLLDIQSGIEVELPAELRARFHTPAELSTQLREAAGATLYLSDSAALELAYDDRLEHLATEFEVFVQSSSIEGARARCELRARRDRIAEHLATLADRIGVGLESGKY